MTPIILLDNLAEFIKQKTENISLEVRTPPGEKAKRRPAEVHKMRLPKKEDSTKRVPYILLQILQGEDTMDDEGGPISRCKIRIVVSTYSEDQNCGAYDVLNVILRIRTELERVGIIADQFCLQKPLEYLIYPDDYAPYYFGEMMTNWTIPEIKREVEEIWQL